MTSAIVPSTTVNVLSGSTIAGVTYHINKIIANATSNPLKAVKSCEFLYYSLLQDSGLDLASLSNQANVQSAIAALQPVAYLSVSGGNAQSYFASNQSSILNALSALSSQLNGTPVTRRVNTSDMVFYQYSRAGEAGLNIQLGQLGDAIDSLNKAVTQLNRVEGALSVNPGQNLLNYRGELMSFSNTNPTTATADQANSASSNLYYYNQVPGFLKAELAPGSSTNYLSVIDVLQSTITQLNAVANLFPTGSDQYQAIQTVLTQLNNYGVANWSNGNTSNWFDTVAPNPNNGDGFYNGSTPTPKNFARLFMDDIFRKAVSDALATAQSQNDVQQQNLRKSQFLYQEFVKSAGDLMDRNHQAISSIIQKIGQ